MYRHSRFGISTEIVFFSSRHYGSQRSSGIRRRIRPTSSGKKAKECTQTTTSYPPYFIDQWKTRRSDECQRCGKNNGKVVEKGRFHVDVGSFESRRRRRRLRLSQQTHKHVNCHFIIINGFVFFYVNGIESENYSFIDASASTII